MTPKTLINQELWTYSHLSHLQRPNMKSRESERRALDIEHRFGFLGSGNRPLPVVF